MASKLEGFLQEKKIDRRQLVIVSARLEGLQPEDRAIRLAKRRGAKAEGEAKKTVESRKPRSGKPVTNVALNKIFAGKSVTGPTRTRVLRAVNHILTRKKQENVELGSIFDLTLPASKSLAKSKTAAKAAARSKKKK